MLLLKTPTKLRIIGFEGPRLELLKQHLEYIDKPVDHQIRMFKNTRPYFEARHGREAFEEQLADLKSQRIKTLLFEDEEGYWTYSGLAKYLMDLFEGESVRSEVSYPKAGIIPWAKDPCKEPRYYQKAAVANLIEARHAAVSMGTGLGKSLCITMLLKELALQSVVMAPSENIATQLFDELTTLFGKKYVGKYYGGKKQLGKLFTVALGQSLTRIDESDAEAYAFFKKTQVFIADESHMTPAETLNKVCMTLLDQAPYRFFFSGTQTRGDGKELMLDGIIGPIVYEMSVREGIDQGFLSKLKFIMLQVPAEKPHYVSKDPMKMTRAHLYYNKFVNNWAAEVANTAFFEHQRQVLILVKEVEQFAELLPFLRCDVRFAHGTLTKETKALIPKKYHDSDNTKLVEQFNNCEFPVLVGTSCISTGTDIKSASAVIFLMGNGSETMTKQGVGRGTRLFEGKKDCLFYDFDVAEIPMVHNQAMIRKSYYNEIYGPVKIVKV